MGPEIDCRCSIPLKRTSLKTHKFQLVHNSVARKRTFLEREEWLTIPWAKHPESIKRWRSLYRIQVFVPGLCEDVETFSRDYLADPSCDHEPTRKELASRIEQKIRELFEWRIRWERETDHDTTERPASTVSNIIRDLPRPSAFDPVLWYSDILYGSEIMMYNNLVVHLVYLGYRVFEPDVVRKAMSGIPRDDRVGPRGCLLIPHEDMQMADLMTEMCRSIDYFMTTLGITEESMHVLYTLRLAYVNTILFSILIDADIRGDSSSSR